jgi:hypothetical protein
MSETHVSKKKPSVLAFTGLLSVVLLGAAVAPVRGQNNLQANESAQEICKSPEGSWLYTVTIPVPSSDPIVFQGVETYAAGGGYSEADQLSFSPGYLATAGHGVWKTTAPHDFLLTYLNLTYDASGNATGSGKVRQTTKIDPDGKSYSGSGDFFYYDLNGNVVASGTFTITAQRVLVEKPQ